MYSFLKEGSEIRGCKKWRRKMSINSRSNQTYHQLQINSQKAKPAHHQDRSNHSLPSAGAGSAHRESHGHQEFAMGVDPREAFSTFRKQGASRKPTRGAAGTAPSTGRAAAWRFKAFLPGSPRPELLHTNQLPAETCSRAMYAGAYLSMRLRERPQREGLMTHVSTCIVSYKPF